MKFAFTTLIFIFGLDQSALAAPANLNDYQKGIVCQEIIANYGRVIGSGLNADDSAKVAYCRTKGAFTTADESLTYNVVLGVDKNRVLNCISILTTSAIRRAYISQSVCRIHSR